VKVGAGCGFPRIPATIPDSYAEDVTAELEGYAVKVACVGPPPADRVRRAAGVSDVELDGQVLRCRVCGSFQPFLEALRGYEVLSLTSAADAPKRRIRPPRPASHKEES
jgi:hypothetical protein